MREFLQTVAKHYFDQIPITANGTRDYLEMTDWMFIFPNRRAGMFFCQHLCKLNEDKPMLAPKCLTIGDLFGLFSDFRIADRTELLFRLYRIQNEVRRQQNASAEVGRFDNFIFWGEMMLRDFDEVDKYLVEADQLFFNVKDQQELKERFDIDEETKKIINTFWSHVRGKDVKTGAATESFVQTWEVLYEIYSRFRQQLRSENLAYEGMRQRDVVEKLHFADEEELIGRLPKRIVLVGITAINKAERELLLWLKSKGILECCWDYADSNVRDISFIQENLKDFGNVLSDEESKAGIIPVTEKKLSRMAVPSGVGQATEAARILKKWGNTDARHTAIVLPDEHLLDSMLYNLPKDIEDYNVTMGYSLKSTPVATLVEALIFLQGNVRWDAQKNELTFYHKAVLALLSHAFLLEIDLDKCSSLRKDINRNSMYQVPQSKLRGSEILELIFRKENPIDYLRSILNYLLCKFKAEATDEDEALTQSKIEPGLFDEEYKDKHILNRECLIAYLSVLDKLEVELRSFNQIQMDDVSLLHLIQKLALGISISFSGEPLQGMQIMGVLETRALDFDRMIILSMNEGVMPAKPAHNSFIPHSLRQAFGLPTQIYKDLVFAYHFYRLISRASEVVFLYDCRADGMQTGEQSRYLLQLEYLAGVKFNNLEVESHFKTHHEQPIEIQKTPEVLKLLNDFRKDGQRMLSASSLKTYIACPLQFYFANVQHLSTENEIDEEMDDIRFGDILHASLETFFRPMEGKMVMDDVLRKAIADKDLILNLVKEQYKKTYMCAPTNGYQQLVCSLIESNIKSVLEYDRSKTPFYYIKGEATCEINYEITPDLTVRLVAVYDRLDIRHNADGTNTLRIIDYKTGSPKQNGNDDKIKVKDVTKIFDAKMQCSDEAFQVLFYGLMLNQITPEDKIRLHLSPLNEYNVYQHLEPNLYFTRSLLNVNSENETRVLEDFEPHRSIIEEQIKQLIQRIFDPTEPFRQTEDPSHCKYCKFIDICNKNIKNDR